MDSSHIPILVSNETRSSLRRLGITNPRDVLNLSIADLCTELSVSPVEALGVVEDVRRAANGGDVGNNAGTGARASGVVIVTALELLEKEEASGPRHVVTCCKDLDEVLGGGIPLGSVTEVCGSPGAGKTQIGMQIAVSSCVPPELGGLGSGAMYLDTEGSFSPQRIAEMAEFTAAHLAEVAAKRSMLNCRTPTRDEILAGIQVFRAHSHAEQLAFVRSLPDLFRSNNHVRVVVVDSIAFHFRHDFTDLSLRARALTRMAQLLNACACEFHVAILVTNHMTTRIGTTDTSSLSDNGELIPALGESWSHAVANRLIISHTNEMVMWSHKLRPGSPIQVRVRIGRLVKSASMPPAHAEFIVSTAGIRNVPLRSTTITEHSHPVISPETIKPSLPSLRGLESASKRLCSDVVVHEAVCTKP